MKEQILIAVDAGKYQTKGIAKYKEKIYTITFSTKMQPVARMGMDMQTKSYHIEYLNNEYILGDMVS